MHSSDLLDISGDLRRLMGPKVQQMCWCKVFTLNCCTPEMSTPLMCCWLGELSTTWFGVPHLYQITLFIYTQIKAWYFTLNPIFTQLHSVFIHKAGSHCLFVFIFQGKFGGFPFEFLYNSFLRHHVQSLLLICHSCMPFINFVLVAVLHTWALSPSQSVKIILWSH